MRLEYFAVDRSLFPLKLRNRIESRNWLNDQMKTPVSISRILGRFLVILCLAGPALAGSNPPASASKADLTPISPAVATNQNVACENVPLPANPRLSPWTREIVKLAQSGIEEGVMVAFIENSGTFELGADQIIYLNDIGIPGSVIGAMLQHDHEVVSGGRLLTIASEPPYEPLFPFKPVAGSKPTGEPVGLPVALPPPVSGQPVVAATVMEQTQPTARHDSMEATSTFTSGPQTLSPEKKRPLYPVREPYPVELLPPIVFFNMAEITPNTLIVYGFPKP